MRGLYIYAALSESIEDKGTLSTFPAHPLRPQLRARSRAHAAPLQRRDSPAPRGSEGVAPRYARQCSRCMRVARREGGATAAAPEWRCAHASRVASVPRATCSEDVNATLGGHRLGGGSLTLHWDAWSAGAAGMTPFTAHTARRQSDAFCAMGGVSRVLVKGALVMHRLRGHIPAYICPTTHRLSESSIRCAHRLLLLATAGRGVSPRLLASQLASV